MKAIIRFILIRYLEGSRPGREEKNPTIIKTMPSSLARVLCYSSLDRAAQTLPDHQQSFTQPHSSTTAACRSPSSICSCCSMETAPRPGLQGFCTGPCQTQLLLPRKFCSSWRRLQKHFDTAFANRTNEPLARFSSQAAAALPVKLHRFCSTFHTPVIMPTKDGLCHSSREPTFGNHLP